MRRPLFSVSLVVPAMLLIVSGLLMQYNLVNDLVLTQLFALGIGVVLFLLLSVTRLRDWHAFSYWLWWICLALLVMPLIFGTVTRGSSRWIQIFGVSLQTSELVRPLLMVVFADIATRYADNRQFFWRYGLFGFVPMLLLFLQPDLGSTILLGVGWVGILFVRGLPRKWLVGVLTAVVAFLPFLWVGMREYQRQRILAFVNPSLDPLGTGYNVLQSRIAIGSGQLVGRGIGLGTQSHLRFLPESHTDFMLASIGEEMGFLGTSGILGLYAILFGSLYRVCMRAEGFGEYLAWGLLLMTFSQFFVNAAMNVGLMPVTGITLPLVSYGGSSLLGMLVTLGLMNVVAKDRSISDDLWIH